MGSPCVLQTFIPVIPGEQSGGYSFRCPDAENTTANQRQALWEYAQAYPEQIGPYMERVYERLGGDAEELQPAPYTGGTGVPKPPDVTEGLPTPEENPTGHEGHDHTDPSSSGGSSSGGGDLGTAGGGAPDPAPTAGGGGSSGGGVPTGYLIAGGLAVVGVAVVMLGGRS